MGPNLIEPYRAVIMVCCCIRFRIPRTKQEIEADYQRKQITKKFREKLQQIKNSEMDDMDLQKGEQIDPTSHYHRTHIYAYTPSPRRGPVYQLSQFRCHPNASQALFLSGAPPSHPAHPFSHRTNSRICIYQMINDSSSWLLLLHAS